MFTEKTIYLIQTIPEGKVMTYGQIAKIAGNPRAARQVARILHSMSRKYRLPWHRVINAKGEISIQGEQLHTQKIHLEMEGVQVTDDNKIDLGRYQYYPEEGGDGE